MSADSAWFLADFYATNPFDGHLGLFFLVAGVGGPGGSGGPTAGGVQAATFGGTAAALLALTAGSAASGAPPAPWSRSGSTCALAVRAGGAGRLGAAAGDRAAGPRRRRRPARRRPGRGRLAGGPRRDGRASGRRRSRPAPAVDPPAAPGRRPAPEMRELVRWIRPRPTPRRGSCSKTSSGCWSRPTRRASTGRPCSRCCWSPTRGPSSAGCTRRRSSRTTRWPRSAITGSAAGPSTPGRRRAWSGSASSTTLAGWSAGRRCPGPGSTASGRRGAWRPCRVTAARCRSAPRANTSGRRSPGGPGRRLATRYLLEGERQYALYRIDRPRSYFLRGRGTMTAVAANRIELADVVPDGGAVVLSLHWLDTWHTDPPLALAPSRCRTTRSPSCG